MKRLLRKKDLVAHFREAGLHRARNLIMHSSLSRLGRVDGGANAVIDAVLEVLGSEGTLMVPTFNYALLEGVFDPEVEPSQTGAITNALRKRPNAVRGIHPTYSVAAIGRRAAEFTAEHWKAEPVGVDSPMDRLAKAGGYIFLLGVKHDTDSTMHIVEAYAHVPYRGIPFDPSCPRKAQVRIESEEVVEVDLNDEPGCSTGFGVIELPLREKGFIQDFRIEQCKCQLVKSQDVIDETVKLLRKRVDILLCSNRRCYFCPQARKAVVARNRQRSRSSKPGGSVAPARGDTVSGSSAPA